MTEPVGDAAVREVEVADITFSGERGRRIVEDLRFVALGVKPVEKASSELSRSSNGKLRVQVSNETIDLLAGRAQLRPE